MSKLIRVQGVSGPKGDRGPQGDVGPAGEMGPAGPKGDRGDVGPAGPTGATGPQGIQGIQGIAGTNGTSFTLTFSASGITGGTNIATTNATYGGITGASSSNLIALRGAVTPSGTAMNTTAGTDVNLGVLPAALRPTVLTLINGYVPPAVSVSGNGQVTVSITTAGVMNILGSGLKTQTGGLTYVVLGCVFSK